MIFSAASEIIHQIITVQADFFDKTKVIPCQGHACTPVEGHVTGCVVGVVLELDISVREACEAAAVIMIAQIIDCRTVLSCPCEGQHITVGIVADAAFRECINRVTVPEQTAINNSG